jgi:DNA polymerase IV
VFLSKVGSDLHKPEGLVVITHVDLPGILLGLELQEIYAIGERMEQRLHRAGVFTVARAVAGLADAAPPGVGGHQRPFVPSDAARRRHPASSSRFAESMGHQHVLAPELRIRGGAADFARHLLTKAAERLRHGDYFCLHLSWVGDLGGWWDEMSFNDTRDTGFLLGCLDQLWPRVPRTKPLSVGVVLLDLVPANAHQPDLFDAANQLRQKLSPMIDCINDASALRHRLRPVTARHARVQRPCGVSPCAGEVGVLNVCWRGALAFRRSHRGCGRGRAARSPPIPTNP